MCCPYVPNKKLEGIGAIEMRHQHPLVEKLSLLTEALLELSNAAASIKNLLLAGVKRVACAANVGVDCTVL
jgi:hypothetical protein